MDFTETIRAVVAERPDFVYRPVHFGERPDGDPVARCAYRDIATGDPSCLIGVVLDRMGLLPALSELGGDGLYSTNLVGVERLAERIQLPLTSAELDAAVSAQMAQDQGYPWSTALRDYESTLADRA